MVDLQISRIWLSERGWGDWKMCEFYRQKIESILGQWMLFHKEKQENESLDFSRSLRIIETDKTTYNLWVRRDGTSIDIEPQKRQDGKLQEQPHGISNFLMGELSVSGELLPILGSRYSFDSELLPQLHATITEASLESICGQSIFSAFISKITTKMTGSIEGGVRGRPAGQMTVMSSFENMRNGALDELVDKVEATGLVENEDIFLSIVPPLAQAGKLPSSTLGKIRKFSTMWRKTSQSILRLGI